MLILVLHPGGAACAAFSSFRACCDHPVASLLATAGRLYKVQCTATSNETVMKLHPLRLATVVAATAMFSAAALVALPANSTASCAQVEVHHVRPAEGALMIAVYADAASFDKKPHVALQLRATAATMNVPICDLAGMSFAALMLYQDLNGNGKLDRNVLGIPSEPWGASGKPVPMAAPTWDATAVPLDGTPVVVKLSK